MNCNANCSNDNNNIIQFIKGTTVNLSFDFDEDIYGLDLEVTFISRIREEVRFDSREELRVQLEKDRDACRTVLKTKTLWTEL